MPETHHEHHHHGQGQVGEGLVEDEHEDRLAGQPGLVEGGDGGDDDQEVEDGLRDELSDRDQLKVFPEKNSDLNKLFNYY